MKKTLPLIACLATLACGGEHCPPPGEAGSEATFALGADASVGTSTHADTASQSPQAESATATAGAQPDRDEGPPPAPDCTRRGDYNECANCLAEQNPVGANSYLTLLVEGLYCGESCNRSCDSFCEATRGDSDDAPSYRCSECVSNIDREHSDMRSFVASCQADSSCIRFARNLQDCPR